MSKLINTTGIHTVNYIDGRSGSYRFITKCRAGYMSCTNSREIYNKAFNESKRSILDGYKKGALQAIEFQPEGSDYWLTIFARVGKKIKVIDESILLDLEVSTINGIWYNTDLYNNDQYQAVNAKTWASKAFVMNEVEVATAEVA